jgi:hypothetical protein
MDNMFLHLEHGNQYMHVAGLGIYDPSTAPGGFVRFKDILKFFEARLDSSPCSVAAWSLCLGSIAVLGGGRARGRPSTCVTPRCAARRLRQLCIKWRASTAATGSQQPLWEFYVIEGLADGKLAFYCKVHHAAIDGRRHGGDQSDSPATPEPAAGDGAARG